MRFLYFFLLIFIQAPAFSESIAPESTNAQAIRYADTVIEGYFTGTNHLVLKRYGGDGEYGRDKVQTVREFRVTRILDGFNLTEGEVINLSTLGGEFKGVTTPDNFNPPPNNERIVIGVKDYPQPAAPNNHQSYAIHHTRMIRYDDERDVDRVAEWVEKVRYADEEVYLQMEEDERAENRLNAELYGEDTEITKISDEPYHNHVSPQVKVQVNTPSPISEPNVEIVKAESNPNPSEKEVLNTPDQGESKININYLYFLMLTVIIILLLSKRRFR